MFPGTGGRVICDLVSSDEAGALYRTGLFTPERGWHGQAHVRAQDGAVTFSSWDVADPPAWLRDYAESFLRSEWRNQTPGPAPSWSSRIARWRAGPG